MSNDSGEEISRMKQMATRLIRKMWKKTTSSKQEENRMVFTKTSHRMVQGNGNRKVFKGSTENFIENGAIALQESVSLFNGKTNPIRYLSVDELNTMNLERRPKCEALGIEWYKGFWNGKWVLVKEHSESHPGSESASFRDIMVSAQMSTHENVHRLLACCIETKYAVLVYEYVEQATLYDLIVRKNRSIDWEQRLKIAWEISHALAYLHTGFQRAIVHRNLKLQHVYLSKDYVAKLSNFSLSISIPEGEEYVEDMIVGTSGYIEPEYTRSGRVAESVDVFAFGLLLLQLLTGKDVWLGLVENRDGHRILLDEWVVQHFKNNSISETIDPVIREDTLNNNEEAVQQIKRSIGLALKCVAIENNTRPTMEEVATELKSMIKASDYVPNWGKGLPQPFTESFHN